MTDEIKAAGDAAETAVPTEAAAEKPTKPARAAKPVKPKPMWDEGEEVPAAGGSWIRQPDGSLVRQTEEEA